jgi:hypothetical protein
MSSETSAFERTGDIEERMRQSLGLNTPSNPGPAPSSSTDPLRGARQAIRSQAAAREYVERQLAHAEATIEDLRGKLHHARRDKDTAVEAARTTAAKKVAVDRTLAAIESAFTTEKVARDRGDRMLREAHATVSLLQAKLDAAVQSLEAAKAELASERPVRQKVLRQAKTEPQIVPPASQDDPAVLPMTAQPMPEDGCPVEASEAGASQASPDDVATIPTVRRPVGRPRKADSVQPKPTSSEAASKAVMPSRKADSRKPKVQSRRAGAPEPVQWWVKGWDRRKA